MKLRNVLCAGVLALSLGACSSTTASSKKSATSTPATSDSSSESEKEEVATTGSYKVTNQTGEKVTGLYFYETGSSDKGENYAKDGLEPDATVQVDVTVDEDKADGYKMTVEYTTEGGETVTVFDSLHLEEAPMYLKPATDVNGGATPFSAAE